SAVSSEAPVTVETRRRGAVDWSHWVNASVRTDLGVAIDLFDGHRRYAALRTGADFRMAHDRVAIVANGSSWFSVSDGPGFRGLDSTLAWRSSVRPRRLSLSAQVDGARVGANAPLA